MRYRVNFRDIVWYRKAQMVGNRVIDATPTFRSKPPPSDVSNGQSPDSSLASNSILDVWEKRVKRLFSSGRHQMVIRLQVVSKPSD